MKTWDRPGVGARICTQVQKKINITQIFLYCYLGKTQASSSSCSCEGELAEQDTHQVLVIVVAIVNIVFLPTNFKVIFEK